ncbi:MAG: pseudouridine synthase [Gemmatimonadota bacterium]
MPGAANKGWTYADQVPGEAAGQAVLEFYAGRYPHSTREEWRARIAAGLVRLDGLPARAEQALRPGQQLEYRRPPWREPEAPLTLEVLHEDADLVAVAKPSGLPVLPGGGYLEHTLLALVRRRYRDRPAPVHRLGRATSGVVLFARSTRARRWLSAALEEGRARKRYRALVQGSDLPAEFEVTVPIGRVPYGPLGQVHAAAPGGRPSRSRVRVLERRPMAPAPCALVEVEIPTGRPHQIRIHLAAAGHPLVGDPLYAPGGGPLAPPAAGRPPLPGDGGYLLHALAVTFAHPDDLRQMTIYCRPPPALETRSEGEDR